MTENMPGSSATKPGDVVTAMNGKTIQVSGCSNNQIYSAGFSGPAVTTFMSLQVDNTDAEGRLILADALCYAHSFNPRLIMDMATLTGAIKIALGCGTAGVFTTSTNLFDQLLEVCHTKA